MFAALGSIVFEVVGSPESIRSTRKWGYAEHKVVEAKPKLQWVGDELEEIALELRWHALMGFDPGTQRDAIYAAADSHQALPFVLGSGRYLGMFVIADAEETALVLTPKGDAMAIQMRVTLKEWDEADEIVPGAPPIPDFVPIGIAGSTPPTTSVIGATGTAVTPPALSSPNLGASALLTRTQIGTPPADVNPDDFPIASIVRSPLS